MSKSQKIVERLLSRPSDFEWRERKLVMETFGYDLKKTGGSGRKFIHPETRATLFIHEPHPARILKAYQVKDAIQFLRQEGHIL